MSLKQEKSAKRYKNSENKCCTQILVSGLDELYTGYAGTYELVDDGESFSYKPGVKVIIFWNRMPMDLFI